MESISITTGGGSPEPWPRRPLAAPGCKPVPAQAKKPRVTDTHATLGSLDVPTELPGVDWAVHIKPAHVGHGLR
jgi:hypothetical protein